MTEAEWLDCTDPQTMLEFLRGKVSDRKLRLFAVACCRRYWHLVPDPRSREAVRMAELYADGLISGDVMATARSQASLQQTGDYLADVLCEIAGHPAAEGVVHELPHVAGWAVGDYMENGWTEAREEADNALSNRLREVISNPFRPVTLNPSWLTPTVTGLAESIYQERAFDRMPILADALEDAGCGDQDILDHCRSGGEHVRGCWVVDLVTGRE